MASIVRHRLRREAVQCNETWERPIQSNPYQLAVSTRTFGRSPILVRDLLAARALGRFRHFGQHRPVWAGPKPAPPGPSNTYFATNVSRSGRCRIKRLFRRSCALGVASWRNIAISLIDPREPNCSCPNRKTGRSRAKRLRVVRSGHLRDTKTAWMDARAITCLSEQLRLNIAD